MALETTEVEKKPRGRPPREPRPNAFVNKMADDLGMGEPPEETQVPQEAQVPQVPQEAQVPQETQTPQTSAADNVLEEARIHASHIQVEEAPLEHPPGDFYPFGRTDGAAPEATPRVQREEIAANRQMTNKPSPSTKRMGAMASKLPGAERVQVHKRVEGGSLSYVDEYDAKDLAQSQNIESFLGRYVRPRFGTGEYQIDGIDAHGRKFDMGTVNLHPPLSEPEVPHTDNPLGVLAGMSRTLMDRALQPPPPPPPQPDAIKMLGDLFELKRQMDPPPSLGSDNNTMVAVIGGLTQVATALVAMFAQPKPRDPILDLLLTKMMSDDKPRRESAPMPPMLPPMDPTEQLKNLAAVMASMRPPEAQQHSLVEYLLKDRMTPADVLGLVNQVKGERGTDDFKKSMENMGIMFSAVAQMKAQTEPGGGSGFWDAVGALASNKGVADLVASKISPPAQQRQQIPVQVQAQDPMAERIRRIEAKERELQHRERQLQAPQPQAAPAPQPQAAPAPQPQAAPAPKPPAAPTPQLPPGISDYINRYVEAKDDKEMVQTTLEMLFMFGETEDWGKHAEGIFQLALEGDKKKFLSYVVQLFMGLVKIQLMSEDLAKKVMGALAENFESIVETVKKHVEESADNAPPADADAEDGEDDDDDGDEESEDVLSDPDNVFSGD